MNDTMVKWLFASLETLKNSEALKKFLEKLSDEDLMKISLGFVGLTSSIQSIFAEEHKRRNDRKASEPKE